MPDSKWSKRIFGAVSLLILLAAANLALGSALEHVSALTPFVREMDAFERDGERVDLVFAGASRTYYTFAPDVFEETLGLSRAVNAGTVSQTIAGCYYQLLDLIERFHPKYAVVGVVATTLSGSESNHSDQLVAEKLSPGTRALFLKEHMRWPDRILNSFRTYRLRNSLLLLKNSIFHPNAASVEDASHYAKYRFLHANGSLENGGVSIEAPLEFDTSEFSPQNCAYLDRIVDLCAENGVRLFLVTAPTTMARIYLSDTYQEATDYFQEYARAHGLIYHNLNLLRGREDFLPDSSMVDYNHVNAKGAYTVSALYAEILQRDISGEDTSGYFYDSVEELKASVHRVVALDTDAVIDGDTLSLHMTSIHSEGVIPQYQVRLAIDGKNFEAATEWSESPDCKIDISEIRAGSKLQIRARTGDPDDVEASRTYTY